MEALHSLRTTALSILARQEQVKTTENTGADAFNSVVIPKLASLEIWKQKLIESIIADEGVTTESAISLSLLKEYIGNPGGSIEAASGLVLDIRKTFAGYENRRAITHDILNPLYFLITVIEGLIEERTASNPELVEDYLGWLKDSLNTIEVKFRLIAFSHTQDIGYLMMGGPEAGTTPIDLLTNLVDSGSIRFSRSEDLSFLLGLIHKKTAYLGLICEVLQNALKNGASHIQVAYEKAYDPGQDSLDVMSPFCEKHAINAPVFKFSDDGRGVTAQNAKKLNDKFMQPGELNDTPSGGNGLAYYQKSFPLMSFEPSASGEGATLVVAIKPNSRRFLTMSGAKLKFLS